MPPLISFRAVEFVDDRQRIGDDIDVRAAAAVEIGAPASVAED
jgi:hypothetical protein